jgi:hypothetical protein
MSNNDNSQPVAATTAPQPVPAAAPKDKTANPPIMEPNVASQGKVNNPAPAQTTGGKK